MRFVAFTELAILARVTLGAVTYVFSFSSYSRSRLPLPSSVLRLLLFLLTTDWAKVGIELTDQVPIVSYRTYLPGAFYQTTISRLSIHPSSRIVCHYKNRPTTLTSRWSHCARVGDCEADYRTMGRREVGSCPAGSWTGGCQGSCASGCRGSEVSGRDGKWEREKRLSIWHREILSM